MIKRLVGLALVLLLSAPLAAQATSPVGNDAQAGAAATVRMITRMEGVSSQEKQRLLQSLLWYRLMEPGEAASRSVMDVLDMVRKLRATAGQTSMLVLGRDLPTLRGYLNAKLDKLKDYARTLKHLERVMGAYDLFGKVQGYWSWSQDAKSALHRFESAGYRDLHPQTRAALSYLYWFGEQIKLLGGKTPLVGQAVEAYGVFLSTVSQTLADNAAKLITGLRGGRLMAGMANMHLTRGFTQATGGIPAITEVLKVSNWNVVLLLDDNTRSNVKPSYYLKVSDIGTADGWVKVDQRLVKLVTADWIMAYHPPRDAAVAEAIKKIRDYDLLRNRVPRRAALGSWPTGREILFLIDHRHSSARRQLPTRGITRKSLRKAARASRDLFADILAMNDAYSGVPSYENGRAYMRDFRTNRRYLRQNCRLLSIALNPRMEQSLLRQYLLHGSQRVERALRSKALKDHPGAGDWLACQNVNAASIELAKLGKWLARFRSLQFYTAAEFQIVDQAEGTPLAGAELGISPARPCGVALQQVSRIVRADGQGLVRLVLPLGCFHFRFSAPGYQTRSTGNGKPHCQTEGEKRNAPVVIKLTRAQQAPPDQGPRMNGDLDCECVRKRVEAEAKRFYGAKCSGHPDCDRLSWVRATRYRVSGPGCGIEVRYRFRKSGGSLTKVSTRRKTVGAGHSAAKTCLRGQITAPPTTSRPRANPCANNPGCGNCRGLTLSGPCLRWCMKCSHFRKRGQ